MHTPLISIIIPVYNASSNLEICIDSVLNQSFTDFELLLVNDGSQDNSGEICDQYSLTDSRIKVFHKPNGGVSSARNVGLAKCKGDYILFCDADDSIDRMCIEKLIEYKEHDIVLCSFDTIPNGGLRKFPEVSCKTQEAIGECLKSHLYTGFSMPWAKLYRREIIERNGLFFDEQLFSGEDTLWVSRYLVYAKSVRLLSYCGYHYNKGDCSSLSIRSISGEVMDDTIRKIVQSYEKLEALFSTDLIEWKLNVTMYFFHRYMLHLSENNLTYIVSKLRENCERTDIRPIFYDQEHVLKGMRLKFFNFMARCRLYLPLALYVKFQKRYL